MDTKAINYLTIFRFLILGLVLPIFGNCHPINHINNAGSVTTTQVSHFTFLQKLGNPCQSTSIVSNNEPTEGESRTAAARDFYQSMITAIDLALEKLGEVQNADPELPSCSGVGLSSLPSIPSLDDKTKSQVFTQTYESGIYLTTHMYIMGMDRQMRVDSDNNVPDNQLNEQGQTPSWRLLRCGNESESLPTKIHQLTNNMEDLLCTLVSGVSHEERATFRTAYNALRKTNIYRYHSSCTLLQESYCVVVKETKVALERLRAKYAEYLRESLSESSIINTDIFGDNELDNNYI